MREWTCGVIFCALLLATGFGLAPALAQTEQEATAQRGLDIVKSKCARCHAIGLDDTSPHEKAPPFRDVVEIYPSEDLAEALAEGIVSGHPDMPVFVFSTDEIEAFLAYLNGLYEAGKTEKQSD